MLCPYDKSLQTHMTGVLRVRADNISNTNMLIKLNDRYMKISLLRYNFSYLYFSKNEDRAMYYSTCHSINLILHPMLNEASHNYYQNCVVILKCGCQIVNFYQLFPHTKTFIAISIWFSRLYQILNDESKAFIDPFPNIW